MPSPPSTTPQTQVTNQTSNGPARDQMSDEERQCAEQPQRGPDADDGVHIGEPRRQRRRGLGHGTRLTGGACAVRRS